MKARLVDLDPESEKALELEALLDWVAALTCSPAGADSIRARRPLADPARVQAELSGLAEMRRYLEERGRVLGPGQPDPGAALDGLAVQALVLAPGVLRNLAAVLSTMADLGRTLRGLDAEEFPHLGRIAADLPDLRAESREVLENIDGEGRILDGASPELKSIRHSLARAGERLRRMLGRLIREPGSESVIRDDFITQRNGRFVIPVRTDAPRPVEGIVHASSSSGATRFIEPLESVELNNELVQLAEREQEEQQRVLAAWSDRLRSRAEEVAQVVRAMTELDDLQARALFGKEIDAQAPDVRPGGPLRLVAARHPLLDRRLRAGGERAVPLDLALDPADRVLVLSGPNAGGKTVALKTLGLLVLMGQSGLPVPAMEARLPLFRQVRADIGDHQSIQADLSTFSAHVRAVVEFLDAASPPSLLLFDEIGTGTEPSEGAALAQSILEALMGPGMTTMATTHHGALKAWAITTAGAACAAMEFDNATLRPTYRILMDIAGVSAGLEIAERMGIAAEIVASARELLGPEAGKGEGYLKRLRDLITDNERARDELRERARDIEAHRERFDTRMERERADQRELASRELAGALEEFRALARRELAGVRDRKERARLERTTSRSEARLQGVARRASGRSAAEGAGTPGTGWTEAGDRLAVGSDVYVRSLDKRGEVVDLRGDRVDVRLGGMTFHVKRDDLWVGPADPSARSRAAASSTGGVVHGAPTCPRELKLVGKRVEEALDELDRFLDRALQAGHDEVRVIHGHGTGRLRAAVRRFLDSHVHTRSHRAGGPGEGGDGATVVDLR